MLADACKPVERKYPSRVGVTQCIDGHRVGRLADVPYFGFLPTQERSLARALREGRYRTWHIGKWHLGPRRCWPVQHGFEVNIGGCEWGHPKSYFSPYACPTLDDGPDGEYLTDRLTDEATRLIEADDDRPFFLNLRHYAVHIPIDSPPELVEKYRSKAADAGLDKINPFEVGEPFGVCHQRHARITRATIQSEPTYAAIIENLDTNVGRLLDALETWGEADNTLLIFTSDNGGLSTAEGSPDEQCAARRGEGLGGRRRRPRTFHPSLAGRRRAGDAYRRADHQPGSLPDHARRGANPVAKPYFGLAGHFLGGQRADAPVVNPGAKL